MSDRLLLVFMIDALGHRMLRGREIFSGFEQRQGPVRSVLGYSSACIPSLLTGQPPAVHGHWAMYVRDPQRSIFRSMRPWIWLASELLGRDGLAHRLVNRSLRRSGLSGYFSLYDVPPRLLPQFDLCQQRDLFAPRAFTNLTTPFDVAARSDVRQIVWSWRGGEDERRAGLRAALSAGDAQLLFFYSPLLDAMGHAHGTRTAPFDDCLQGFADFVAECSQLAARNYREVRTLIFGDHGMADTTAVHDLYTPLRKTKARVPRDFLYFLDSTMGRFWFFDDAVRRDVTNLLAAQSYGRVLSDDECAAEGILFPDRRYGELIFLADPGVILAPSFMGHDAPRAMHGYHPSHEDSDTALYASFPHEPVRSIMGIGPLISEQIMWLSGAGTHVGEATTHAGAAATQAHGGASTPVDETGTPA